VITRLRQGLIIALGIVLAAVMVALGFWQLEVYHRQGEAAAARRADAAPIPLSSVARPGSSAAAGFGRSVTFEGSYDPALQLLVPAEGGTEQFRVLTGLRQADGSVVAVVRGVISRPPAPAPPSGQVQQIGVLLPTEEHAAEGNLPTGQIASVRLPTLAQQWPSPLIDGFVTLSGADAASQGLEPATLQLPESPGRLRNGAYVGQWWLFAAFALFMAVRMARDIGVHEAEMAEAEVAEAGVAEAGVAEITAERPGEPT
jgi:cytochrome oxidase assembly protein ShyY1